MPLRKHYVNSSMMRSPFIHIFPLSNERNWQYFIHRFYKMEFNVIFDVLWELHIIFLIHFWDDDLFNSCSVSCNHFLFESSNFKYSTTKSHLSCHRNIPTHRLSSESTNECGCHGDTSTRSILRYSTLWHVNMNFGLL